MSLIGITLFGYIFPMWLVFLLLIIGVIIAWKLIKFTIKILLVIIVFFVILLGLDLFGVFEFIQNIISSFA
ncbi:MAG: hypothetical protein MUO82_05160 [Candidatus Thermoplasmatota archaeon]|nr:hypothetical protein [Candidatus Thermoplasmatota archaeon]